MVLNFFTVIITIVAILFSICCAIAKCYYSSDEESRILDSMQQQNEQVRQTQLACQNQHAQQIQIPRQNISINLQQNQHDFQNQHTQNTRLNNPHYNLLQNNPPATTRLENQLPSYEDLYPNPLNKTNQ